MGDDKSVSPLLKNGDMQQLQQSQQRRRNEGAQQQAIRPETGEGRAKDAVTGSL